MALVPCPACSRPMEQSRQVCVFCAQQGVKPPEPKRFTVPQPQPVAQPAQPAYPPPPRPQSPPANNSWVGGVVALFFLFGGYGPVSRLLHPLPEWEARVSVFPPAKYTGALMITSPEGSTTRSVEGSGTGSYPLGKAQIVSINFQKGTEDGTITVTLYKNGEVNKTESSSAAYGVVGFAGSD